MDTSPLVVEITRSGVVESTHLVDVAIVDPDGALRAQAGDPERLAAFRSSVKPIQARASRSAGWIPHEPSHLAIACASHNAEPAHVRAARHVLLRAGVPEDALACPPAWPFLPETTVGVGCARRIQHNCSGKHAAFLAACAAAGWPLEGYLDPAHPLQRLARELIEEAAGMRAHAELVDGCGAPTLVFPLRALARAFTTVVGTEEADAMRAHPFLVAGSEGLDTVLLEQGIVTKAGAEGLGCIAVTLDGAPAGIALKVRDGTTRARVAATAWILEELGIVAADALDGVFRSPPVRGGGARVGGAQVRGQLRSASAGSASPLA